MRKFMLVLILVSAMAIGLAGSSHAVQLQQGWYAHVGEVNLAGQAYPDQDWFVHWFPSSAVGQFGPVLVEGTGPQSRFGRRITITQDLELPAGVLWESTGTYSGSYPYFSRVEVGWETDYVASRLQLQVLRRRAGWQDELIWTQTDSGYHASYGNVWDASALRLGEEVVLRLVAVPEPPGLCALGLSSCAFLSLIRRRTRR